MQDKWNAIAKKSFECFYRRYSDPNQIENQPMCMLCKDGSKPRA